MKARKQHGRRRADKSYAPTTTTEISTLGDAHRERGRRRADKKITHWYDTTPVRSAGAVAAACAVALTLTSPISQETAASKNDAPERHLASVIKLASTLAPEAVTASATATMTFKYEGTTSTRDPDYAMKKLLAEKAEKDKAAAEAAAKARVNTVEPRAVTLSAETNDKSNRTLSLPLRNIVETSGFGKRVNPITGEHGEEHTGQDYSAQCGTEVIASAGGTVVYSQWHEYGGGNRVEIDHGNGLVTSYNHLQENKVKVGQKVQRGDVIALVGTTGSSTGCHLHFEVLIDDVKVDPKGWL